MSEIKDKLFKWLLKKYIVQGYCQINFVMREVKEACREEYSEDNNPTLKNYIQCALDEAFGTKHNYGITWHERQLEEARELIKAVAHIGIDWGYGKFELTQDHIDKARKLYEAHDQLKEQG